MMESRDKRAVRETLIVCLSIAAVCLTLLGWGILYSSQVTSNDRQVIRLCTATGHGVEYDQRGRRVCS